MTGRTVWGVGGTLEFILFGLTLAVAVVLHRNKLTVAVLGLLCITSCRAVFDNAGLVVGIQAIAQRFGAEGVFLLNIFGLLLGFALLADHFDRSGLPQRLFAKLPEGWRGGFVLLTSVFILSSFLDNIAAALIGGSSARAVFRGRVHAAYLAAIVAASNAGGAGSVIGDTTTTMMWIRGVHPAEILSAYIPSVSALVVFGVPAAVRQQRFSTMALTNMVRPVIDRPRLYFVMLILAMAVTTNLIVSLRYPGLSEHFPWMATAVWLGILATAPIRPPNWSKLFEASRGGLFLVVLLFTASLMPLNQLPIPSTGSTLGLGLASAVVDNIPLTRLALAQGGYDWGLLAFAVGFGGSMMWFGSSAGVAIAIEFPAVQSAFAWLRHGWPVGLAYVVGTGVFLLILR